jgi:hypothetical protein
MSFKFQVFQEFKQGKLSTYAACSKYRIQARFTIIIGLRKFGNFYKENKTPLIC